jgi:hypothetical protein
MPAGDNGIVSEPSVFVKAGLLVPLFILYAFAIFLATGLVFILIEKGLPGSRLHKGAMFSLAYGLLWFLYFLEPLTTGPQSLIVLLAYPVVDGTTFALLGLLLGWFVGTDSPGEKSGSSGPGILALAAIPVAFAIARLCAYGAHSFFSAFDTRPFDTLLWVAATGVWIGAMYFMLRPGIRGKAPLEKAAFFGLVVVGLNLLLFNLLIPIVFAADPADLVIRTAIDAVAVTIGVYICEKIGA